VKRDKTAGVPLTVAERTLGSLIGAGTHYSMMHWPSIQKDKASISTGLRRAGVCQSLGAVLGLVVPRRTTNAGGLVMLRRTTNAGGLVVLRRTTNAGSLPASHVYE
jgi:hypothetical protein